MKIEENGGAVALEAEPHAYETGDVVVGRRAVSLELFSSSFCGACSRTRQILDTVARLVPEVEVAEHNVADDPDAAAAEAITATPTVIIRGPSGAQLFRAEGVPTINQVLAATAKALDSAND